MEKFEGKKINHTQKTISYINQKEQEKERERITTGYEYEKITTG
jgi:hypothetical protein